MGEPFGEDLMFTYNAVICLMRQQLGQMPPMLGRVVGAAARGPLFTRLWPMPTAPCPPINKTKLSEWRTAETNNLAMATNNTGRVEGHSWADSEPSPTNLL